MNNIYNLILILTFGFVYFTPQRGNINSILTLIYYLIIGIMSLIIIKKENNLKKIDKIIIIILSIITILRLVIVRDLISVNVIVTILTGFIICRTSYKIDQKLFRNITIVSLISICLQMLYFRHETTPVMSIIDPNYTGFYIFLIFIALDKLNSNLKYIALALGFITLSRNFIITIILYIIVSLPIFKNIIIKLKLDNFFISSIISIILLLGFSYFFTNNVKIENNPYSITRIFHFNDASNMSRFNANIKFVEEFISNKDFRIYGENNVEEYKNNVYKNVPHNAFLDGTRRYGIIMYIVMFIAIGVIYNTLSYGININIILSLFAYFVFLGGVTYGYKLILILLILKFINDKEKIKY